MAQLDQFHQPRREARERNRPIEHVARRPLQPFVRGLQKPLLHPQPLARPQHHPRRHLALAHARQHRELRFQPHRPAGRNPRRHEKIHAELARRRPEKVQRERHDHPPLHRHPDRPAPQFVVPDPLGVVHNPRLLLLRHRQFRLQLAERDLQPVPLPRGPRKPLLQRRHLRRRHQPHRGQARDALLIGLLLLPVARQLVPRALQIPQRSHDLVRLLPALLLGGDLRRDPVHPLVHLLQRTLHLGPLAVDRTHHLLPPLVQIHVVLQK